MIANFLPKKNELVEQSLMFNESLRGFGYKCRVLIPTNIDLPEIGYAQDIGYNEDHPTYAYVSMDSHPQPKLLQKLGWDIESTDTKPMICYISRYIQPINRPHQSMKDLNEIIELLPTKYTRLLLDYDYDDLGKEFIVTKVSSNSFNPIYYILMIVPYRPAVPPNIGPLQDHNLEHMNVQESSSNSRFLKLRDRSDDVPVKY